MDVSHMGELPGMQPQRERSGREAALKSAGFFPMRCT